MNKKYFNTQTILVIAFVLFGFSAKAVEMKLTFTSTINGFSHKTDSIEVINISQNDTLTLYYPDTVLTFGATNSQNITSPSLEIVSSNYPNPFSQSTNFRVSMEQEGLATIGIYTLSGKKVSSFSDRLTYGMHEFNFSSGKAGIYFIQVSTGQNSTTIKAICNNQSGAPYSLTLVGKTHAATYKRDDKLKSTDEFIFTEGDTLEYTGYMTNGRNYKKRLKDTPTASQDYVFPVTWYYWNNAQRGIEAAYLPMTIDGLYKRMYYGFMDLRSDEAFSDSYWELFSTSSNFTISIEEPLLYFAWNEPYVGILRANEILEYYPKMDMDEDLRNRMMGEAYFLRGFYYYHLLTLYREIPIYDHLIKDGAEFKTPQVSRDSAWKFAINEFQKALPMLPTKENANVADSLNATQGAAAAFLAKSYILTEQWQKASDLLSAIIDGDYGSYALMEDYNDNFTEAGEHNDESLFEVIFTTDMYGDGSDIGWTSRYGYEDNYGLTCIRSKVYVPNEFGGWGDIKPGVWLKDAFLQDSTIDKKYDPRLAATFYFDQGIKDGLADSNQFIKENYADFDKYINGDEEFNKEANVLLNRKNIGEHFLTEIFTDINLRIFRYAEMLLLQAEALNELGRSNEAIPFINQVRSRVNLEEIPLGLTADEVRDTIANERLLEFCMEAKRYPDIVRWGWLSDEEKLNELKSRDSEFDTYQAGREYLPVPQRAINENPELEQDYGWE